MERESIFPNLVHSPKTCNICDWVQLSPTSWDLSLGFPHGAGAGTKCLSYHLMLPKVSFSKKWKSEADSNSDIQVWDGLPKQCFNHWTNHPPPLLVLTYVISSFPSIIFLVKKQQRCSTEIILLFIWLFVCCLSSLLKMRTENSSILFTDQLLNIFPAPGKIHDI